MNRIPYKDKLDWLSKRETGIGGSDVAAVLGISRWKSPIEVYLKKTGKFYKEITDEEQLERMRIGQLEEEVIATLFCEKMNIEHNRLRQANFVFQHEDYPFMLGSIDRQYTDDDGKKVIVECKHASEYTYSDWDEKKVPLEYLCQLMHYLIITDADYGYFAVKIGNRTVKIKRVERDQELEAKIINAEKYFWENYVEKDVLPPADGSIPTKEILDGYLDEVLGEMEEERVEVNLDKEDYHKIEKRAELKSQINELENKVREIDNSIKQKLIERMGNVGLIGNYEFSVKTVISKRIDTKRLKEDNIYDKYAKESTYQKINIKEVS